VDQRPDGDCELAIDGCRQLHPCADIHLRLVSRARSFRPGRNEASTHEYSVPHRRDELEAKLHECISDKERRRRVPSRGSALV
jgi:hypothetical protein